jgi:hypothetical protein
MYVTDPYKKLLKAIKSAPLEKTTRRRGRKKKKQSQAQQGCIVDRVYEEVGQSIPPELFCDLILEPLPKLAWTKSLSGYEEARLSAEKVLLKLYASTDAAQVGFESETAMFDVFFYKVRVGLIQIDSPKIPRWLQYAQHINKADWFIKRSNAELNNAKKRVPGAPQINEFRTLIVVNWVLYGFWLMSDDLIARVATTIKLKPDGCNRQTITKAVKELGLVKHQDTARAPIVKSLGKNGVFVFRQGYPPTS